MEKSNYIITAPGDIEKRSFEIITEELGHINMPKAYEHIIKRVVHTTADYEYARLVEISPNAIESAQKALKKGCGIYADTNMIIAGTSKPALKRFNCDIYSYVSDEDVINKSKEQNLTRSILGINKTAEEEKTEIYVIGNAPTALVRICELIEAKKINPALVIGVPVGFVGAAESKEMLMKYDVPYITVKGRKGGSTVAVAILNALMYDMGGR